MDLGHANRFEIMTKSFREKASCDWTARHLCEKYNIPYGSSKKNLVRARIFDVVCYTFKNKLKNFIWLRSENHLKCIVFWCEYVEQFSAIVFFLYAYAGIPQTAWFHDIWVFCTKGFQINIHIIRPKLIIGGLTCKKHYFTDFCIMLQMCTISCAAEIESNSTQNRLHYIEDFV